MRDITWCVSKDCKNKCERHTKNCSVESDIMVSIADFSRICRNYIGQIIDEINKKEI